MKQPAARVLALFGVAACMVPRGWSAGDQTTTGGAQEKECRLTVTEAHGAPRHNELVIVSGAQLLDLFPGQSIPCSTIQVFDQNKTVPSQVDEKDETGAFVKNSNGLLDLDDEICFQVSLSANSQKTLDLRIGNPVAPTSTFQNPFSVSKFDRMTNQQPYHLLVGNGLLEAGICGFENASDVPANQRWKEWHPGCINFLRAGKHSILGAFDPNSNLPGRDWPESSLPSRPEVLVTGPVRLIVEVEFTPCDIDWSLRPGTRWDFSGILRGAVQRNIFQFTADSTLIDFTQSVTYESAADDTYCRTMQYLHLNLSGHGVTQDYVVYSSDQGKPRAEKIHEAIKDAFKDERTTNHFGFGGSYDGWVAIGDPVNETGFAIFGAPRENRMGATVFAGTKYNTNYPISIQVVYTASQLTPARVSRHYWYLVFAQEGLDELVQWRTAYLHPLQITIGPPEGTAQK